MHTMPNEVVPEDLPEFALGSFGLGKHADADAERLLNLDIDAYTLTDVVCMQMYLYQQSKQILAHVAGIEQAFREVANTTEQAMGMLGNSPIGGMLAKLMGRAKGADGESNGSS